MGKVSSIYEATEKEEFIEIFQDFLNQCAIQRSKVEEDKKYTPPSIAKLLVALADPYEGNIYDPCFGTAGLLVEATKYIRNQKEEMDNVFFFGQELATDIHQFAKINQAINRCEFKLGEPRNTFSFDLFRDKKMDYILANFPMNKRVEEGRLNSNDERWIQFGMPCNENCA
ncbi:hypothetical protein B4U78_015025 [Microbacterium esteraromaticum]|nr:hypothetical protein B4U78_015025 [Microbacterium esteraromaticum]